ncbi:MAG: M56/M15 family metallopeptidase, partial [Bacteroidota bacterium]
MKTILFYLLQVIIASGILYGYYHFFLRNKRFHSYNRYFLLATTTISICVPFLNIPVYFTRPEAQPSTLLQTLAVISTGKFEEFANGQNMVARHQNQFSIGSILVTIYIIIALAIISRFITALLKIKRLTNIYQNEKIEEITFINTNEQGTPFSFFRLLFWNQKISLDTPDGQQIFRHELFHIHQKHSYDIIFIEILSAVFWFNPFFHLTRKELKTIHEFLADESAVNKNEEWDYAELLLMQVLGSPNNRLTNPFFHNQIKRRIAMITSSQKTNFQYLRKVLVLPIAAMLVALFAFSYKTKNETLPVNKNYFENPLTVIIDAGHGGKAGAKALDGTYEGDIALALAKKVKELNKNDRIKIVLTRDSYDEVDLRKRSEFANAQNPDLFISIHLNNAASTDNDKSGFDVFISKKNSTFTPENKILGTILLNYFSNIYPVEKKIQQQNQGIWVLDNSKCPSVLVECGYLSNKKDLAFIKETANQELVAHSILQSIEQYAIQKDAPDFNERKKQV